MSKKKKNYKITIPVARPWLGRTERRYVAQALASGWISSRGGFIDKFEARFAGFCGVKYASSVCNGTVALHLALVALGIGPGDEVIVPSLSFIATANAVAYTGATPVFADIDSRNWCLDPSKIEAKITKRTKAVIPVHLYGHPAEMKPIMKLAGRYGLFVVEDAAEAHGAEVEGRMVGGIGDIGTFSFFGNKILTTGEGGMVVTNNRRLAEKMNILKNHGMDSRKKYWHPVIGYNYRMTNLQAAVGLAQLEKAGKILAERDLIRRRYDERLKNIPGITLPPAETWSRSVCWLYSILVGNKRVRDGLLSLLRDNGIESRPFFFPMETMPPYRENERCAVSARISARGINLPSAVGLTDREIEKICAIIVNYVGRG